MTVKFATVRLLWRAKRRWKNIIKMNLKGTEFNLHRNVTDEKRKNERKCVGA
jgi:hypothetical protein